MTARRVVSVALLAAAALAPARAPAQDAASAYFSVDSVGWVQRVAAGADGSVYAAGVTLETDLPGALGLPPDAARREVFVSSWSADGQLRWTRYLPYGASEGDPPARAIGVAADGSVWVAWTAPTSDYAYDDVGVARLGADGSVLYTGRFGGARNDRPTGLVVTAEGDAIVAGSTWSPDFPTTDGSSLSGGASGAFVACVRGDASGLAWSQILDVSGNVRGTALSSDGNGGVLAAYAVSRYTLDQSYADDLATYTDLTDLGVVQLSADGAVVATTPLPHGDGGAVFSLAACADGSMLAAGRMTYDEPYSTDAFVMRVRPDTGAVTALWKESSVHPARIAVEPSGDVLVGTNLVFIDPRYVREYADERENSSRLRRLGADLRETATLFDRDGLRSIDDFGVAPEGALCVIGHGSGVSFAPVGPPMVLDSSFVARLPREGALPPSAVKLERVTARGVRLSWQGGDEPASYVIERSADPATRWDAAYEAVREVGGGVHEARVSVRGMRRPCRIRVVAEFASGVRMASAAVMVLDPPSGLTATRTAHGVQVEWRRHWLANDLRYELQRRLGAGAWQTLAPSRPGDFSPGDRRFFDRLPPLSGTSVRYRLRVVPAEVEGASPWIYSN